MTDLSERLSRLSPSKRALLHARLLHESASVCSPQQIAPRPEQSQVPLSFAQKGFWFLDQLWPGNSAYNIHLAFRLEGFLDVPALERSLSEIRRRHHVLRTIISNVDGQPVGRIDRHKPLALIRHDLCHVAQSEHAATVSQIAAAEARSPFNLSRDSLLRGVLLSLAPDHHVLLLTTHHIAFDGSADVFFRELNDLYIAFSKGHSSPLPELPIQYADFAHWQHQQMQGEFLDFLLSYWRSRLGDHPVPVQLWADHPPPLIPTFRGERQHFKLSSNLSASLIALSRRERATLFMVLLAAFKTLLTRYTERTDILVASPFVRRPSAATEDLIGCFAATLLLRTDLSGDPTFSELLARVRDTTLGAHEHGDLPLDLLVESLQPQRDLGKTPLCPVMFSLSSVLPRHLELPRVNASQLDIDAGVARFDLLLTLWESNGDIAGLAEYSTDLFEAATISRMLSHFQILLNSIVADPNQRLSRLPLLTDIERNLFAGWNNTHSRSPDLLLHELFESHADQCPNSLAVVSSTITLTYGELERRSNRLGHRIRRGGARPNDLVAVVMEKGWKQVVGVLGVLKAGAAYMPLDARLPQDRLLSLLSQGHVKLIVTDKSVDRSVQWPDGLQRLFADEDDLEFVDSARLPAAQALRDLAYVIFTSGSTGQPKGVMIDHRAAVNTIIDVNERFGIRSSDRLLALSSLCFDLSVYDIFGTLAAGATIVVPDAAQAADPSHWAQLMIRESVTVWNSVPALLQYLVEYVLTRPELIPSQLRVVLLSGDWLPLKLPSQIKSLIRDVRVASLGGATEASIWSVCYTVETVDPEWSSIPYGRPMKNQRVFVLDETLECCPIMVPGQLHISGIGLAQGYWQDPDKSAACFPVHPRTKERLYATGDLARYRPDGNLELLGRIDQQVKIRGFRVELGEIESVLACHPEVREAVVIARREGSDTKALVAYVVASERSLNVSNLRRFLEQKLPHYMIPSAFVMLEALPRTPNGKIDRRALPDATGCRPASAAYFPPCDTLELRLTQILERDLDVRPVGTRDDFFHLGGHSLMAARLMASIDQAFKVKLPVATLFEHPTVERLASLLRQNVAAISWSPLLNIQPGGQDPPFFCVHPASGSSFPYLELARHLGCNQPFYGLQARGTDIDNEPCYDIESMAISYVGAIRTAQPEGPYVLGGASMGGIVALEMAQQLQAQSQKVALLVLMDTHLTECGNTLVNEPDVLLNKALASEVGALSMGSTARSDTWPEEVKRQFECLLQERNLPASPTLDVENARLARLLRVFAANLRAVSLYIPRLYRGRVLLFRAAEPTPAVAADGAESTLGWSSLVAGELEVRSVPGDHYSMLQPPHVHVLAEELKRCFEQARGSRHVPSRID